MDYEFKTFSSLETVDVLKETDYILIEEDGSVKRISSSVIGGASGDSSDSNESSITDNEYGISFTVENIRENILPEPEFNITLVEEYGRKRCTISGLDVPYLPVGTKLIVTFNGVEYECYSDVVESDIFVGNASLVYDSVPDTGEPFLVMFFSGHGGLVFYGSMDQFTIGLSIVHQCIKHSRPTYVYNGTFSKFGDVYAKLAFYGDDTLVWGIDQMCIKDDNITINTIAFQDMTN